MPYISLLGQVWWLWSRKASRGAYLKKPMSYWWEVWPTSIGILNPQMIDSPLLRTDVNPHSPLLELVWLGHSSVSLPKTDEVSLAWVMEGTGHSSWLFLFYNVSNLQVLECLLLTLSGSLSYFRVNKSCFRHHTEQIQFVFMKNSPWKMGTIVYWLRLYSEPDSLKAHPSFAIHQTVWPWLSDCTSSLHFLIYYTWIILVPVA